MCVSAGCTPEFDVLITRPCDLERRDRRGHTVLWHALLAGVQQNSMAQRLVTAGASVDAVSGARADAVYEDMSRGDRWTVGFVNCKSDSGNE